MWRARRGTPRWWTFGNIERTVRLGLGTALVWQQGSGGAPWNPYVFAAGLTMVGAGEAIRWDLARRTGHQER